ncbi:hypothetical protein G4Y79_03635 [Phototrophicus methaneseepsis]|uniref:Uncharacterized protein n=1 Tax=Phototrophicus methaneseepsis TaxID=2710758 RepID=A0A7S8EAQ7_9CHLR|nr:hypothetical protein [Phototrophicus methaneseepsis]QPC83486.1 hypothetical protein G4Y79_03635 [Phototrophicus methaneseepsis]
MVDEHQSHGNTPLPSDDDWITGALSRGWAPSLHLLLDVVEPIGPLAAQIAWVLQPAGSIFGAGHIFRDLAQALETSEGIQTLRRRLDDEA